MTSDSEGAEAVRCARSSIEAALGATPPNDTARPWVGRPLPPIFDDARGVFVTLRDGSTGGLRGCIGYPLPVGALRLAIPRMAVAAATEDPRFPPVVARELSTLVIEVSILTVPERLKTSDPDRRAEEVVVGRDGLIVDADGASGLLLPQVAPEQGWNAETFLGETCRKAGLPRTAWRRPSTRVRRFEAEVFGESSPGGPVTRSTRSTPS